MKKTIEKKQKNFFPVSKILFLYFKENVKYFSSICVLPSLFM